MDKSKAKCKCRWDGALDGHIIYCKDHQPKRTKTCPTCDGTGRVDRG